MHLARPRRWFVLLALASAAFAADSRELRGSQQRRGTFAGIDHQEHLVHADPPLASTSRTRHAPKEAYAPTFHPSASSVDAARVVNTTARSPELRADGPLRPVAAMDVGGTVVDPLGRPLAAGLVRVWDPARARIDDSLGANIQDGSFRVRALPQGTSVLRVAAECCEDQRRTFGFATQSHPPLGYLRAVKVDYVPTCARRTANETTRARIGPFRESTVLALHWRH